MVPSPLVLPPPSDWTIVPTRRRRVTPPTLSEAPIATCTRAQSNRFAALAEPQDFVPDPQVTGDHLSPVAFPVLDAATGQYLEHRQLRRHPTHKTTWDTSYVNELGRLCQGVGRSPTDPSKPRVAGTDTFRPIHHRDIPHDRLSDVTYTRVVCEVCPQKDDPNRTRITIGGNRICYPGDCCTKTCSLELTKLLLNSIISTPNAHFACFNIKNFYLGTPLDRPEYVRIKISAIPQEFVDEYDLTQFVTHDWVYFEINKGVYGLKQADKLANDLLTTRLADHGS